MRVDGGSAHLQPEPRRPHRARNGLADGACRIDAGIHDFAPIASVVAAVDAAAGEIDHDVGTGQLGRQAIPTSAPHEHHLVSFALEGTRQDAAEMTGTAGDDDLHIRHL